MPRKRLVAAALPFPRVNSSRISKEQDEGAGINSKGIFLPVLSRVVEFFSTEEDHTAPRSFSRP